ncbi:unnamed protein product [Adineta ricciae]|uniref:NACHT domain-containing protein n=1 Tax=Adineta ricciae TaxID=249248 RepID=A0A815KRW3_ADIRI|nr:unnamed protein product [Adineta ricciae]CAF1399286.1 unnamed protein product [Adineta ricciae]
MSDDETILTAIDMIDRKIESLNGQGKESSYYIAKLMVVREDLEKLFSLTSSTNTLVHLFCRRMNRLIKYNNPMLINDWLNLHADLLLVLEHHDESIEKLDLMQCLSLLKLEIKMEEREIQFEKNFGRRKTFLELAEQHRVLLDEYLQACYSLHSKIQIQGLVENVDGFLREMSCTADVQTSDRLETRLNSIDIPLICPYQLFQSCTPRSFLDFQSRHQSTDGENVFLPGMDEIKINYDAGMLKIHQRLLESRWLVVLGDPGSSKTTLLRYITQLFASAVLQGKTHVATDADNCGPLRIPILVRIGEFSERQNIDPNLTLFDYIGKHTWFSQLYGDDNIGSVLKDFIRHGHALVLLDGLDEISAFEQRTQIVKLIREFIHEYVYGDDFISAFDDVPKGFNTESRRPMANEKKSPDDWRFREMHPPSLPGGNQIVITSRIVGCNLYRFNSRLIDYYNLLPMSSKNAKLFIEQWFTSVDQEVRNVLTSENIHFDKEKMDKSRRQRQDVLDNIHTDMQKSFLSHPLMLSLMCSCIFKLLDDSQLPKTVTELYDKTIRSVLGYRTISRQSRISQDIMIKLQSNLALYLHAHSSSGVIDEFDFKRICGLVLKQENVAKTKAELSRYTDELLTLISSNNSMIVERGLKVFSFTHLSFQEYFVGLSLIDQSSIEKTIQRILIYAVKPRSREPIRFALGWINQTWPSNDRQELCRRLVTETINSVLPLGAILFFDVIHSIEQSLSNCAVYAALDQLIDHPSMLISIGFLGKSWPVLPLNAILRWMELTLTNDKRVVKFCKSFLFSIFLIEHHTLWRQRNNELPAVCQRLWSLHSMSSDVEVCITQTLYRIVTSLRSPCSIFQRVLPQYLQTHKMALSQCHPLVTSVIIALYGGAYKTKDEMGFSHTYIYRNSIVGKPILDYLTNTNDSYSIKVSNLIEQYEDMLRKYSSDDVSNNVIDILIALICLRGLSQSLINYKFGVYRALPLALDRFKVILFLLRDDSRFVWDRTTQVMFSGVKLIIDIFASQPGQTIEQSKRFTLACIAACDRLKIDWTPYSSSLGNLFDNNTYQSHRLRKYSDNNGFKTQGTHVRQKSTVQLVEEVYSSHEQLLTLLKFVPSFVQRLYYRLLMNQGEQHGSPLFIVLLSQCLTFFDANIELDEILVTLNGLLPLFRMYNMQNYVLALFWESKFRYMSDPKGLDDGYHRRFSTNYSENYEDLIVEEQRRILQANVSNDVRDKDFQLFTASLSLARLYQIRFRYGTNANLSADESEHIQSAIENINDQVLYIVAMNIILNMNQPSIFDTNLHDTLRSKLVSRLLEVLPNLLVLTGALLLFRCQVIGQSFPLIFQQLVHIIGEQLLTIPLDEDMLENQKAVYVALSSIENSSLNSLLIEFKKQVHDDEEFLDVNSVVFHRYLTSTESFGELDDILLCSMYLSELAVDAQNLRKYMFNNEQQNTVSLSEKFQQLLKVSKNVITSEIATLIVTCVANGSEKDFDVIDNELINCNLVEKDAQPVLLEIFNLPMKESSQSLVYYIALLLAKDGSNTPASIDYIRNFCQAAINKKFEGIIKQFLELSNIHSVSIRQVLETLLRCMRRSSFHIRATIRSREIMQLILQLENEESRTDGSCVLSDSFLMLIDGCSFEVQNYLLEYLNADSDLQGSVKEQRLIRMITWVMQHFATKECPVSDLLYKHIVSLFQDRNFSCVQETIIDSLRYIFLGEFQKNVFTNKDVKQLLEKTINHCVKVADSSSEKLLANCLNTYGCCIRFYKACRNENPSDEMINLFTRLFQTSSSSLVATRASQCLLKIELYVHSGSIDSWLSKTNLNPEQLYNIFIRCTFDECQLWRDSEREKTLAHIILQHPTDLLPKFVNEMYVYLKSTPMTCKLSKDLFSYVTTANQLCVTNFTMFRTAVEKQFHNAKELKLLLYQISKQGDDGFRNECISLYAYFGEITSDLIDMILTSDLKQWAFLSNRIESLITGKQISLDREIVESLYEALETPSRGKPAAQFLIWLVNAGFISVLEVFQRISSIVSKQYLQNEDKYQADCEHLFETLLKLTCIQLGTVSSTDLQGLLSRENKLGISTQKRIYKRFHNSN